jgi:hypothetical protein
MGIEAVAMSVLRILCPHCGRLGSTTKALPEGVKIRCPGCEKTFVYAAPPAERPIEVYDRPEILDDPAPVHRLEVIKPPPLPTYPELIPVPVYQPPPIQQVVNVHVATKHSTNSFFASSFSCLGCLGALGAVFIFGTMIFWLGLASVSHGPNGGNFTPPPNVPMVVDAPEPPSSLHVGDEVEITGRTLTSTQGVFHERNARGGPTRKFILGQEIFGVAVSERARIVGIDGSALQLTLLSGGWKGRSGWIAPGRGAEAPDGGGAGWRHDGRPFPGAQAGDLRRNPSIVNGRL